MGVHKKFSEELYKESDDKACQAVLNYLNSQGSYAVRNPDKYGPDIILYIGFKPKYYIEVEVKKVWRKTQYVFPWPTIQLPERKKKFIGAGKPIEFFILREDLKMAVVIDELYIRDELLVEVPNSLESKGEYFFQIPIENTGLVRLV